MKLINMNDRRYPLIADSDSVKQLMVLALDVKELPLGRSWNCRIGLHFLGNDARVWQGVVGFLQLAYRANMVDFGNRRAGSQADC